MNQILILGGSSFIGRNLVEKLDALPGVELTIANRGVTNKDLFKHIPHLKFNRNENDTSVLTKKNWDYIIDLSCYFPNSLENILKNIKPIKRYVFISTCSVYNNNVFKEGLGTENAPVLTCSNSQKTDESTATYGNRKSECERILKCSKIAHTILRPALVYGKYDPTDRFYYWLHQVQTKQSLLVPEGGKYFFSTTYVNDLVDSIVLALYETTKSSTYNVITTPQTSILKIIELTKKKIE